MCRKSYDFLGLVFWQCTWVWATEGEEYIIDKLLRKVFVKQLKAKPEGLLNMRTA